MQAVHRPDGREVSFSLSTAPVAVLAVLIGYGLMARPLLLDQPAIPLEAVFVLAASAAIAQLLCLGFTWGAIQESIVRRLARAMPAIFILFAVGLVIGAWMVSGTIPMLVYWGTRLIDPAWIYTLAFVVPAIFSTLTGTSWGSAGTIGVVIMGVCVSIGADTAVTAGAIIGGALFGDKLSPLSDTTNVAAIGAEVALFDHIRSMLWTTVPSALIAVIVYGAVGLFAQHDGPGHAAETEAFLSGISQCFEYHLVLLVPPLLVLVGPLRRWPTLPVLLASVCVATALALLLQPFDSGDVFSSLVTGFRLDMAGSPAVPESVARLLQRGGLYGMREAIFIAILVFLFVGAIDLLDSMPRVVGRAITLAKTSSSTVLTALGATAVTNAMTSNQLATSFIVGDAFGRRFDDLAIPRTVLSRSIEDTGTMIESLIPWHATALFMVATLGVSVADYWQWQILSLANLVVAPLLAITGLGCFYHSAPAQAPPAGAAADGDAVANAGNGSARAT